MKLSPERRRRYTFRPAGFARKARWYWRLVRDMQIKEWGFVKKKEIDR